MRTKQELSTAVLQNNRYVGAGETPAPADAAVVEDAYDAKLAEWRRRGLVWWTNTNRSTSEIPNEVFSALTDLMVNEVKSYFEVAQDQATKRAIEEELLRNLRRMNHKPATGESTPFSVF